jgi:hypothetical protein
MALILLTALFPLAAWTQSKPTLSVNGLPPACESEPAKFQIKPLSGNPPAQPEPGKALLFLIEKDVDGAAFSTPTASIDMDGKWLGATHGASYFYLMVDSGVHHFCSTVKFGGLMGSGRAMAHLNAEAGNVYYFEVKNTVFPGDADTELLSIDSDEGQYLISGSDLVVALPKK